MTTDELDHLNNFHTAGSVYQMIKCLIRKADALKLIGTTDGLSQTDLDILIHHVADMQAATVEISTYIHTQVL